MSSTNRYVTGMFLVAAMILLGGFYLLRGASRQVQQAEFDLSYSMPRPKSALYNFFFGLEGREIDHQEINPFKGKKNEASPKAGGLRKDAPKIPAAAQKGPIPAKKAPVKTAAASQQKAEVQINVVDSSRPQEGGEAGTGSGPGSNAGQNTANNKYGNGPQTIDTTATNNREQLSGAQWRALVVAQPTKENVAKLIAAFNNKEVDASTLYLVMNDLMQSSNPETQGLGLMIGQEVPSLKSFSITAENYEKLDTSMKAQADTYLLTYMQQSRLGILALALQSENNQVVYHATRTMVVGLDKVKNSSKDGARSVSRGVVASSNNNNKVYSPFVAILEKIIATGDSSVVPLAQNALTQIQALSNT